MDKRRRGDVSGVFGGPKKKNPAIPAPLKKGGGSLFLYPEILEALKHREFWEALKSGPRESALSAPIKKGESSEITAHKKRESGEIGAHKKGD